jgi:hypothetical protein
MKILQTPLSNPTNPYLSVHAGYELRGVNFGVNLSLEAAKKYGL